MARTRAPEPRTAQLSIEQMKAAIPKLERRITDLRGFNVSQVRDNGDPAGSALAAKVDGTLQEILGHGTVEYNEYSIGYLGTTAISMFGNGPPLSEVHQAYRRDIDHAIAKLQTLKELYEERVADAAPQAAQPAASKPQIPHDSRRVFVVHGHDDGTKETVARFLQTLKLVPIILHEQPNQGRTVIEKFEKHSDVAFAVVLLTPDDVGHSAREPEKVAPRARQNVVLEMGYFLGSLGRNRVCVLHSGGVEFPSDYAGVVYVAIDESGAWRLSLAREIKSSGIMVDLNNAM